MANTLLKTGITTGESVEAWHVTQSIDAFSGLEEYDITLSGSLTLQNGTQGTDKIAVSDVNGVISFTGSYSDIFNTSTNFNNFTSSYNTGSFTGSFTGNGGNLTGITASIGPNFSNTDLTFTGNRSHDTSGSSLEITTDGGIYNQGWIYMDINDTGLGNTDSTININKSGVIYASNPYQGILIDPNNNQSISILPSTSASLKIYTPELQILGTTTKISGSTTITGSLTVTRAFMHDGITTSTGSDAPSDILLRRISTWVINITGTDVAGIGTGNIGQRLLIYVGSSSGTNMTITPSTTIGYSNIILTNVGDSIELYYNTGGWVIVGGHNYAIT